MAEMEPESADSIVTDPPYGIKFLGLEFDHSVPGIPFWQAALRVAKPGAHLLAFGGMRTSHRLACAIEDAGWEIRDTLMWMYGQGMPKGRDIGKALDKRGGDPAGWFGPWLKKWREEKGVTQKQVAALFLSRTGALTGCVANWELGYNMPTNEQFNLICKTFGFPFDSMNEAERKVVGRCTDGAGNGNPVGLGQPRTMATEYNLTAPATDLARQWDGWNTQLKPAVEIIIMARKPFKGNVESNVVEHGCGAINVGACRIAIDDGDDIHAKNPHTVNGGKGGSSPFSNHDGDGVYRVPQGRYPSNVILSHLPACRSVGVRKVKGTNPIGPHPKGGGYCGGWVKASTHHYADPDGTEAVEAFDCAEECPVRMLDLQSGERRPGERPARASARESYSGRWGAPPQGERIVLDSGGASRFMFCPKASPSERGDFNTHSTVKPIMLMSWLVRLVTQPGGLVLDPFMGSGTTALACLNEGMRFVGVETDPDYLSIAEKRIALARASTPLFQEVG